MQILAPADDRSSEGEADKGEMDNDEEKTEGMDAGTEYAGITLRMRAY